MNHPKSFFKTEAVFTMLFNVGLPVLGLLLVLIVIGWRWLSR